MSAERSSRKPDSQPYEKATTWSPTPGEVLRGTLEHAAERQTRYGPCTVANVRCEDSDTLYGVWLSHTVLASKWDEASPRVGDHVAISYEGKVEGALHPYHDYTLDVRRAGETLPLAFPEPDDPTDETPTLALDDPIEQLPY